LHWARRHRILAGIFIGVVLFVLWVLWVPIAILLDCRRDETRPADAAVILGAAVYRNRPSPVFRERIRHGVNLYRSGTVPRLLFTGGRAQGDDMAEAEAARSFAISEGVRPDDILIETSSTTTWENFTFAVPVMRNAGIRKVLVVSDPMHMHRSMAMARALRIEAYASPTPTSLYRSFGSKWMFLRYETKYYLGFLWHRVTRRL
jgi:uncharacterized SAM-binding protein YcdF (DUF218 family)